MRNLTIFETIDVQSRDKRIHWKKLKLLTNLSRQSVDQSIIDPSEKNCYFRNHLLLKKDNINQQKKTSIKDWFELTATGTNLQNIWLEDSHRREQNQENFSPWHPTNELGSFDRRWIDEIVSVILIIYKGCAMSNLEFEFPLVWIR